jgi:hypothetical protein
MNVRDAHEAAAAYASHGWRVFPCIENGPKRKTALIGAPMGVESAIVLDIDMRNGVDGYDALRNIPGALPLPLTPVARTPSGGFHFYFDPKSQQYKSSIAIGFGIDVKPKTAMLFCLAREAAIPGTSI